LRLGELVGTVSALGLLAVSFLPWFSAGSVDISAWQAFSVTDLVLLVAAIMSLSVVVVTVTHLSVSYPVAGSAMATGAGALAFVLVLYRLIDPPGGGGVDRELGAWLGLLACAGMMLGGYLGMEEPGSAG
jgi:Tfp pilus assembly protein PilZ